MLTISESAQVEMKKALEGRDAAVIRVFVAGYGCGGASLGLTIDEHKEGDIKLDFDGYSVVIDPKTDEEFSGVSVDYRDSDGGSGFVLKPGVVVSACGSCSCG
jgi:iron-sulfur cluster insertion protein